MKLSMPITMFTPSFADADNTNAQNLTVKEIVARLAPELFRVTMIADGTPDSRLANRPNTEFVKWSKHGNSVRLLSHTLATRPDIYFFPRYGLLDRMFLKVRRCWPIRTALLTYVVMSMEDASASNLAQESIESAEQVFANSKFVAKTVSDRFGRHADVIYDGVDKRFFYPPERTRNPEVVVLYAGSFQSRKRVEFVIEQAARYPSVRFRIAGCGETEASCRDLAGQHGCTNISFLGHLSSEKLGEEMREADIFFFPSILEGHPQVLGQAAACGLPVIAMSCYRPDYVIHGKTGFLADSGAELGSYLDCLIANRSLRSAMSAAALRHVRNFDWDRIARQWANVFQQIAETRQKLWLPRTQSA